MLLNPLEVLGGCVFQVKSLGFIMGHPSLEDSSRISSNDRSTAPKLFPEAIITEPTIFRRTGGKSFEETESLEDFYQPIAEYQGRHRYDPKFQWDAKQERRVVRRIDARICTWACLMFFALQLDRGNISQALSDNLLDDLEMTTNQVSYHETRTSGAADWASLG